MMGWMVYWQICRVRWVGSIYSKVHDLLFQWEWDRMLCWQICEGGRWIGRSRVGLAGGRGRGSLHFRLLHAMPAEPRHAPPTKLNCCGMT